MKKKTALTVFLTCSALLALAACSKEEGATETAKPEDTSKRGQISVMIYDRARVPAEEGNYEKNRWTEWINKNGPVDVNFVPIPRNKPEEKLNLLFASGSAPDLIIEYSTDNRNAWYASKQIQPIGDAIEKYSKEYKEQLQKYPILRKLGTRADGKLYDVGFVTGKLDINWMYLVRADWLKALKLEAPKTVEELYAAAKAMTEQDPDGNGKKDTYGMGLAGHFNDKAVDFMFGNPIIGFHVQKDDSLVFGWDNLKASTEFKKRLFQEGIVDKDFAADSNGEKLKRDFVNGKVGFYSVQNGDIRAILEAFGKNVPNGELIPIPLPKSSFGQFSPPIGVPAQVAGVVNSAAKDLKSVVQYIDFLSQEKTVKTLKWGIEGENYKLNEKGCPNPIDAEKNKKEIGWSADYSILSSQEAIRHCDALLDRLDPNSKSDNTYKAIVTEARKQYLTIDRPIPGYTSENYVPSLPTDLKMIQDSFKVDELLKSVITPDYSPDKAVQGLKDSWQKAGGAKIDDWYKDWFKTSKDKAILIKDIYELNK